MNRIYLAGPFFTEKEIENCKYVEKILETKGISYFSPRTLKAEGEPGTGIWAKNVFDSDVSEINRADAVLALYYGSESDSGTAWESGYATATGKPVILVHVNREGDSNLMLHVSCKTNVYLDELADLDFDDIPIVEYRGKMF